jgi:hypothetical protein
MGDGQLRSEDTDMPVSETDDPEMSYLRGYQHGALETFRAVERFLDPATRKVVRTWIEDDIYAWRLSLTLANFGWAYRPRGTRNIGSFSTIS